MKINYQSAVIFVKDIERSKKFYTELLQQEVEYDFGKNIALKSGLSLWEIRDTHIIAEKLKEQTICKSNRFELYFETDDIQKLYLEMNETNPDYLHKIHEEPWGQITMRFFDPDGHLVEIGETMPIFVRRMAQSNMHPMEISEKTHIPVEMVVEMIKE